jgi:hypothetical protein
MGSIAGSLAGELNTVYSNAIIEGERLMYGGLVAAVYNNKAKITNCWYDGQIKLGETGGWVGGIAGLLQSNKEVIIEHLLFQHDSKDPDQPIVALNYSRGLAKVTLPEGIRLVHISPADNIQALQPSFRSKVKGKYMYPSKRIFFTIKIKKTL